MKIHLLLLIISALLISSCSRPAEESRNPDKKHKHKNKEWVRERKESKKNEILAQIKTPAVSDNKISIIDFGASGDSLTDCKPAFDLAFREAERLGGAHLTVPAGTYFIKGPLHLVSNLCLELQEGCRLKFSETPQDYLPVVATSWEGTLLYNYSPLIYAYDKKNISIIGKGIIDGNSAHTFSTWRAQQKPDQQASRDMNHNNTPVEERVFGEGHFLRPQLIQLYECQNILLEDFMVTNSPFWCIHLLKSENITARGIRFNAKNINNDGFDPEYSRNILIENIDFDNGDDNIAIKAGRDHEGRQTNMPCENIIIRNCRFKGLHAVVIGSEMSSGVQNVFVENCTFGGYCKRGIYLKSNPDRGGYIRNIFVDNVTFDQVEDAFFITSFYHNEGSGFATDIYNIFVDSLFCRKADGSALTIQGYPDKKVRDVYFSNISIDSAAISVSFNNAENIQMDEINIGGRSSAPSFAGASH